MSGLAGLDPGELGAAWTVLALGAAVQGSVGFGLALVAAPLLILIEPRLVPGPLIAAALVLIGLMSHRERRAVDLDGFHWALLGRLVGVPCGALALVSLPHRETSLLFAALVLAAVAMSATGRRFAPRQGTLLGAGLLSGFMGTFSAIGGPPLALVYQDAPGARVRGTLAAHFLVGALLSLGGLAFVGRFGWGELRLAAVLVPGVVVGFVLSLPLARRLDRGETRRAVLAVSTTAAILVMAQAFR